MRKYVGKDGMPVVEFDLSDIHKVKNGELTWPCGDETECIIPTSESGERTRYTMTPDARWEFQDKEREQHKADYFAEVDKRFIELKADLLKRLQNSPDREKGRMNELKEWERILEADDTQGFKPNEKDLRAAWNDITKGIRYQRGEPKTTDYQRFETVRHTIYPGNLVKSLRVDKRLRRVYTDAEAGHEFLQWLRDTPAERLHWDTSVWVDFGMMWAENLGKIVSHFSTPESAEVRLFRNGNQFVREAIAKDWADMGAARNADTPTYPQRTIEIVERNSRGEATKAEMEGLLKAKLEASADYHTPRRLAAALLAELEGLLQKHTSLMEGIGGTAKPIPIALQWKDHLKAVSEAIEQPQQQGTVWTLEPDYLKGNAQAAKVRAWQDVVDYFNTEGAEVQLFTSENAKFNEAAQTDLEMIKAYGELRTTATRELLTEQLINDKAKAEADPSELQALFDAKLSEAIRSGKARTPQGFAKAQINRLGKAWADIFDLFPIAEQYTEHLKGIAEATEKPAPVADTSAAAEPNEGGKGAEKCLLSYPEVALILAYERISVTNKAEAAKHGAKYGRMTAANSDLQLLNDCILVYSASDRLALLNEENNGRKVSAFKRQLKKIEPHLSDKAKPLLNSELQKVENHLVKLARRTL